MAGDGGAPILGLSGAEAAQILGVNSEVYVHKLVWQGVIPKERKYVRGGLDREDVERVALERYKPGHPYWLSGVEAAQVLGLSRQRVQRLAVQGRLPFVEHKGRRFYRRHQLEVIANARRALVSAGVFSSESHGS
jgi:excisionase family DNA binding protein